MDLPDDFGYNQVDLVDSGFQFGYNQMGLDDVKKRFGYNQTLPGMFSPPLSPDARVDDRRHHVFRFFFRFGSVLACGVSVVVVLKASLVE